MSAVNSDRLTKKSKPDSVVARPPSDKLLFWLDEPAVWTREFRRVRLTGWCVGQGAQPLVAIRARIGRRIFEGRFDRERLDVLQHLEMPTAPAYCGFTLDVLLPWKSKKLLVEVADADRRWHVVYSKTVCGPFRVGNRERELWREMEAADARRRYSFWFDRPSDWNKPVRMLHVSGWCLAAAKQPITEIRARVRGKSFRASYGIVRPDVAVAFENKIGALRSGFSIDVTLPRGSAELILEARRDQGPWDAFFKQQVRGPVLWQKKEDVWEQAGNYSAWVRLYDELTPSDRAQIRGHIASFVDRPLFSVLLPVYNSNPRYLRRAIASVRRQLYPHWELCIVDDASTDRRIGPLLQKEARADPRIKLLRRTDNGHICAASNDALGLASGKFIALLDHDDELAPTALYYAALELNNKPDLQLLYSDEDKLDKQGRRCDPYFKSDWNPDLFTSQNYISHLSIYRTDLVRKVGGFRVNFEGSQDYDLTLRCIEQAEPSQIRHIPHVLYHWRIVEQSTATFAAAKPYAQPAAIRAMQDHLDRLEIAGAALPHYADYLRVKYSLPVNPPLVSIIIPTRDRAPLLRKCLQSLFDETDYPNYEVIIIDNDSSERDALDYLSELNKSGHARVHRVEGPFNYSRLNNIGASLARGSFIALLNNDLEAINRDWLAEMVSQALRPEIGAVGARLWYPDKTMQHGGVILGAGGVASHAHVGIRNEHGYFGRAHLTQNFSAVTAACMVLKKDLYLQLGGFDEINLPVAFNDVDFCLRLREEGFRIVWTPHAELFHHESASRGFEDTMNKQQRFLAEVRYMEMKWKASLAADPYYNPNLSLGNKLFTFAFPPRVTKPWRQRLGAVPMSPPRP